MIYAFGSNGSGQLGIGHRNDTSLPQPVTFRAEDSQETRLGNIKKIVAGGNHTLVLDDLGQVFAAGENEDGRCGYADAQSSTEMRAINTAFGNVFDVSAGWTSSFFVAADRRTIYACGTGEHGQLGLGTAVTSAFTPSNIAFPGESPITVISSCVSHTVVVLENGQVWGWGKGRKGQLGSTPLDGWQPHRIEDVKFHAVAAVTGADFTCVLGARDTGDVLILGSDKRDRFKLRADIPKSVSQWSSVAASWGTVYIHLSSNGLICWGRRDRGQIPPEDLPKVASFIAGSEHWLALSQAGEVLTGGWGEHGNCGPDPDENGVVMGRYNLIPTTYSATAVFAGCATSFILERPS